MASNDEAPASERRKTHDDADNHSSELDEKSGYPSDDKFDSGKLEPTIAAAHALESEDKLYDTNGKEKVLETAADFATALVSLEDDPGMYVHTFRMWFVGIGLAVFGAVLGMLFVSSLLIPSRNR